MKDDRDTAETVCDQRVTRIMDRENDPKLSPDKRAGMIAARARSGQEQADARRSRPSLRGVRGGMR